jgi:hypothetical protein
VQSFVQLESLSQDIEIPVLQLGNHELVIDLFQRGTAVLGNDGLNRVHHDIHHWGAECHLPDSFGISGRSASGTGVRGYHRRSLPAA